MAKRLSNSMRVLAGALFALAAAAPSWAVDGVVLIDMAKVGAAGGFPYRITQSGSYRLAGNLNIYTMGFTTNAIEVTSAVPGTTITVSLDLNGFGIYGNPVCDFNGQGDVTCTTQGGGNGIFADASSAVSVTGGAVRGMGNQGVMCLGFCRVEGMTVANNGGFGVSFGRGGLLTGSTVTLNRLGVASQNAVISGNVVQWNLGAGIGANNTTVQGNSIHGNGGAGLAGSGNAYANNHFGANAAGGAQVNPGNVQTAGNVCNGAACP